MKIRIKFRKQGRVRFIGHLDVMRYFQKLNRRANVNIKYSGGYSPHQEMSFATPLGLGLTSDAEYADMEFLSVPGKQELIDTLNAVNIPELRVLDAVLLPDNAKNAMSLLMAADYTVSFNEGYVPEDLDAFYDGLFEYLSQPEILVEKETKKNRVTVDLKKQIRKIERKGDAIFMQVDTGSVSNLKPELVYDSYAKSIGFELSPYALSVNRDELYGEEDGVLKKLSDYGTDF